MSIKVDLRREPAKIDLSGGTVTFSVGGGSGTMVDPESILAGGGSILPIDPTGALPGDALVYQEDGLFRPDIIDGGNF